MIIVKLLLSHLHLSKMSGAVSKVLWSVFVIVGLTRNRPLQKTAV
jgi:hypothetical protein